MSSAKHTARHDSPIDSGMAASSSTASHETFSGASGASALSETSAGADAAIAGLHRIDEKVNALRASREADPDSLLDKAFKATAPALVGMVAGKVFQTLWDKGTARRNLRRGLAADAPQGLVMSLAFAAASAAFGAVISQLSDRGSQALVDRRHRKSRAK